MKGIPGHFFKIIRQTFVAPRNYFRVEYRGSYRNYKKKLSKISYPPHGNLFSQPSTGNKNHGNVKVIYFFMENFNIQ